MRTGIQAASDELLETDKPVAEIALGHGFYDQSAFTRQFRQHTGETPLVFRRLRRRTREVCPLPTIPTQGARYQVHVGLLPKFVRRKQSFHIGIPHNGPYVENQLTAPRAHRIPDVRGKAEDAMTHDRGQAASLHGDASGRPVTSLCDYREFTACAK